MGSATKRGRAPARSARGARLVAAGLEGSRGGWRRRARAHAVATGRSDVGPGLSIDHLLELQRTAGNRAVSGHPARPRRSRRRAGGPYVGSGSLDGPGRRARGPGPTGSLGAGSRGPRGQSARPEGDRPRRWGHRPDAGPHARAAGHGGGVDQASYLRPVPVIDARVEAQYQDPASVVRSPSVDWHEQMWLQMKRPEQPDEAPVAFSAGRLIAVHPRYPGPATGIPSSYSGDDKTGLGTPQPATQTPLDRLPPRPERPMTRAIAPGFNRGQELATRDTAVAATHKEVLAAIAADPRKVVRSPSAQWHSPGAIRSTSVKGGDAPPRYKVGGVIVIAPDSHQGGPRSAGRHGQGVRRPQRRGTYPAPRRARSRHPPGDVNVAKGALRRRPRARGREDEYDRRRHDAKTDTRCYRRRGRGMSPRSAAYGRQDRDERDTSDGRQERGPRSHPAGDGHLRHRR